MTRRRITIFATSLLALASNATFAQGHGHGHHTDKGDGDSARSDDDDREVMRQRYDEREHSEDLPPGLAKRNQLPPGLEKQLRERGTLPAGLRKKIEPCSEDLERRLLPPSPDYDHLLIGGHIVSLKSQDLYGRERFPFRDPLAKTGGARRL
jgi:hypothetical protein